MKDKNVIGILGGMGPQASARLVDLLVARAKQDGAIKDDDFPEIILDSVPVPDFISDTKKLDKVTRILQKRIRLLSKMEVSRFAIACNTAHVILEDLKSVTDKKFVSIIDEVSLQVKSKMVSKVGLLATPTTIRFALFQKALSRLDVDVVIPTKREQGVLERIIRNMIAGKIIESDKIQLVLIAKSLGKRGAEGIILGCTELPLIFPKKFSMPVFNSLDILADSLLSNDGVQ